MASEFSPKAEISPKAKIGNNCKIHPFVYIEDNVVIGDDCVIHPFVSILNGSRIGNRNRIFQGSVISALPEDFEFKGADTEVIVGNNNVIRENVVINRGTHEGGQTIVGNNNFLMEGVHILHDTKVGNQCVFGYSTKIAGDSVLDDGAILSSAVLQLPKTRVGKGAFVTAGSIFNKDVPPYCIMGGYPIAFTGVNSPMCKLIGIDEKVIKHIGNAYRLIYNGGTSLFDAILQVREQVPDSEEIRTIIEFAEASEKGLAGRK